MPFGQTFRKREATPFSRPRGEACEEMRKGWKTGRGMGSKGPTRTPRRASGIIVGVVLSLCVLHLARSAQAQADNTPSQSDNAPAGPPNEETPVTTDRERGGDSLGQAPESGTGIGAGGLPTAATSALPPPPPKKNVSGYEGPMCRDRTGFHPPDLFKLTTCGFCFTYLYAGKSLRVSYSFPYNLLVVRNGSDVAVEVLPPDVDNQTVVQRVCESIRGAGADCGRWESCCREAEACCRKQLQVQAPGSSAAPPLWKVGGRPSSGVTYPRPADGSAPDTRSGNGSAAAGDSGNSEGTHRAYCPATWDGYSCWNEAAAGSSVTQHCAAYIDGANTQMLAAKVCHENGSWYKNVAENREWTDYGACIQLGEYSVVFWVGLVANAVSLLLLIPACFIFLYFRSLRGQHRIKLHICLFFSYIFTNLVLIIWETMVVYDRLNNLGNQSVISNNSVGCRVLHIFTRYGWLSNFTWMFLEGLHLYRLMVHAFAVPRSMMAFYIGGISAPLVPTIIYVSIRASRDDLNTKCWIAAAEGFEWVIYIPIMVCLVGNILFLAKILHVMLTQLQSHPNEPSSYRRAVKAACILIPLFGLQAVLVIFRPANHSFSFEGFNKFFTNTQGAFVAIGFCYLNGEVLTLLRNSLPHCLRSRSFLRSDQRSTVSTQFTTDVRPSLAPPGAGQPGTGGYIPLSTLSDDGRSLAAGGARQNSETERLQNGLL